MTVIVPMTPADLARAVPSTDDAGLGALRTERGNLPLDRLDLRADITGLVSRTQLTQEFVNVHDQPLEATYVFPLPDRAAVTGMRMTAADRTIDAVLQERGAAREAYDQAIASGHRASIAEEERPDVFTMRVGNILPGERVTITLTLAGPLVQEDGAATFRFPLVVAPRYIPGTPLPGGAVGDGSAQDTDAVPDASRVTPPVLLPGFPNPLRLTIDVGVDAAGLPLSEVRSSLHEVTVHEGRFRIAPGERADRDFILRFPYGAETEVASLSVVPDADADADGEEAGTFQFTVLPPAGAGPARPRDLVLLLDRSGSMDGWKMVAARRAASRIVDTLTDGDRFTVLAFDHTVETPPSLPSGLVAATDRHRFRAVEHLARMDARGGTELLQPLRTALQLLASGAGERDRVLVLVTDGQVGNEDQILRETAQVLGGVRVHTVGIDRAVNAGFLGRLAAAGGGRCELVESEDRLDEAMDRIHRRIGSPLVTGLTVAGPAGLSLVSPSRLPDLFPGVPLVVRGRYAGAPRAVTLTGTTRDGRPWTASAEPVGAANPALTAIWARAHLRDLEDRYAVAADTALEQTITATSLRFGVLCRFTAYLAVDSRVVAEGGPGHRITQPVEAPSGWDMLNGPVVMAVAHRPMAKMRPAAMPVSAAAPRLMRSRGGAVPPASGAPMPPPAAPDAVAGAAAPASAPVPPPAPGSVPPAPGSVQPPAPAPVPPAQFGGAPSYGPMSPAPFGAVVEESAPAPASDLAALASEEARRMRAQEGRPRYQQIEFLEDLGSRLAALATTGPLAELAAALQPAEIGRRAFEELWAYVLRVLDEVAAGAGPGAAPAPTAERRRSFWKR